MKLPGNAISPLSPRLMNKIFKMGLLSSASIILELTSRFHVDTFNLKMKFYI